MKKQLGPSWSQQHWSPHTLFALAVIIAASCISVCNAAPVHESTELEQYSGTCYYNYNHYNEGDRILTNEPCLNCTCHNQMLMCYLRVCPFTKPIGHDCVVEKREDQCCPIITCPDVPVELVDHKTDSKNEVGFAEKYGCYIESKFYPEGAQVPSNPNKPCELCYCIRNRTSCLMQECTLHVDGCQPIYNRGVCCPVRYDCEHDSDLTGGPYLEDSHTTVRPTEGFILTTSPSIKESTSCVYNDVTFGDGALIPDTKPCEHCYCMKGDIVCAVQECAIDIEHTDGKNCTYLPPPAGECCPQSYICQDDDSIHNIADEKHDLESSHVDDAVTTTSLPAGQEEMDSAGATESSEDLHNKLHETISEEDVQLQEHIDDIPLTSTAKPLEVDGATTSGGNIKFAQENELGGVESTTLSEDAQSHAEEEHKPMSEESSEQPLETGGSSQTPSDSLVTELPVKSEVGVEQELMPTTDSSESSFIAPNEIVPIVIPGEGDCLLNSVTYQNNTNVPSVTKCDVHCICLSSIIKCKKVECVVALGAHCRLAENQDPEACCPTYECDGEEPLKEHGIGEELLPTASTADSEHEQSTTVAGELPVDKKPEGELTPDHESKPEEVQTEQSVTSAPAVDHTSSHGEKPVEHEPGSGADIDDAHIPHLPESDIASPEHVEDHKQTEMSLVDDHHIPESQTEEGLIESHAAGDRKDEDHTETNEVQQPALPTEGIHEIIEIQPTHTPEDISEHEQTPESQPGSTETEMEQHPEEPVHVSPQEEVTPQQPDTEHSAPPLIHHPVGQEPEDTTEIIQEQELDAEHGTEPQPEVVGQSDTDRKHILPEDITSSPALESMSHVTSASPVDGEQMIEEHSTEGKKSGQEMLTEAPLAEKEQDGSHLATEETTGHAGTEEEAQKPEIQQPEQPEPEHEMTTDELMSAVLEILKGTDAPVVEQAVDQSITTDKTMEEAAEEHVAPEHVGEEHAPEHSLEQSTEQGLEQSPEQGLEESTEQDLEQAPEQGMEHSTEQGLEQTPEQGLEHSTEQGLEAAPEHGSAELPELPIAEETPKPATSEEQPQEGINQQPLPTQQPAKEPAPAIGSEQGLEQEPIHETVVPGAGETPSSEIAHTTEFALDKNEQPEQPIVPEDIHQPSENKDQIFNMMVDNFEDKTTAQPEISEDEGESVPAVPATASSETTSDGLEPSVEQPIKHTELVGTIEHEAKPEEAATIPSEGQEPALPAEQPEFTSEHPAEDEHKETEQSPVHTTVSSVVEGGADKTETATELEHHVEDKLPEEEIATSAPIESTESSTKTPGLPEKEEEVLGVDIHATEPQPQDTATNVPIATDERISLEGAPEEHAVTEGQSASGEQSPVTIEEQTTSGHHLPSEEHITEGQLPEEHVVAEEKPTTAQPISEEKPAVDGKVEEHSVPEVESHTESQLEQGTEEPHVPVEHLASGEQPVTEAKPSVGELPASEEEKPVSGEQPASEDKPSIGELPAPEEEKPVLGEQPASEDKPSIGELPAPEEEKPVPEEQPASEEKPSIGELPVPEEEKPVSGEQPASEDKPSIGESPVPEEEKPVSGEQPVSEDKPSIEKLPIPVKEKPVSSEQLEHSVAEESDVPVEHATEGEPIPSEHIPEAHIPEEEHISEAETPAPESQILEERPVIPEEQTQAPEQTHAMGEEHTTVPEIHGQVPEEQLPEEHVPVDQMPEEPVPVEQMPEEHIPVDQMPEEHIPVDQMPEEHIPVQQLPEEHTQLPEQLPGGEHTPEQQLTEEQSPQEHLPAEHVPEVETTSTHLEEIPEIPTTAASIPDDSKNELVPEEHVVETQTDGGLLPVTEGEHIPDSHIGSEHVPESHTEAGHLPESQTEAEQLPESRPESEHLPEGQLPESHPEPEHLPEGQLPESHVAETATEQALPGVEIVTASVSEEAIQSSTIAVVTESEDGLKGEVSESTTVSSSVAEEVGKPEQTDLNVGAIDATVGDAETSSGDSTTVQPALGERISTEKAELEEVHTTTAPVSTEVKDDKEHVEPIQTSTVKAEVEEHKTESSLPAEGSISTTEIYEQMNKTEDRVDETATPAHPHHPESATHAPHTTETGHPHQSHLPHYPHHPPTSEESSGLHPTPSQPGSGHFGTTGGDNESGDGDLGPLPGGHYSSFGDEDYNEEEDPSAFGPGTCRYGGKLFVSAQQIPRDDPCDFCFCFRSDIICLQQSCPPPISGCHEEPISGFCCPRYECPVLMGGVLNLTTTTTTTTTMPPLAHHRPSELIKRTGCYIGGQSYKVGDAIESASGPCINCSCGGDGQMKCEPKVCTPEPMLRQMIAVVASRRRR